MRRNLLIALGIVVVVWAALAIALGSPSLKLLGGSGSTGTGAAAAPDCLAHPLDRTARLPGTGVDVSPGPETDTANPHTQISFLGVPAAQIHDVSVVGSRSGAHAGHLRGYSQADGASFVPDRPFAPGERVSVRAVVGGRAGGTGGTGGGGEGGEAGGGGEGAAGGADSGASGGGAKPVTYAFRVDVPYPTASVGEFPNPPAAPADYQSFYTLPGAHPPALTVTVPDGDPAAGDVFTTNGPGPGQYGPLIYTPQGRLVWVEKLPRGETAENLKVQSYKGQRDLTWWRGRVLSLGFGQGEDVVMNSRYQTVLTIPGANGLHADLHDFQIAPREVAYITAFNPIRCNLTPAGGERDGGIIDTAVQEIDMKTGLVRWEWHSLDHVPTSESENSPPQGKPWDWFHINSIDAQPDGDVFISARNTWAGYQLEGGSGRILWQLGGAKSSFKLGPGVQTAWQHDGRILPDGEVTFFDDGSNPPAHAQSRAVRIALDFATHEARLRRAIVHPLPLLAASQGNVQTLPEGNTVVGYGAVPQITEYAPDGALLWDAHMSYDLTFYRAFRFPWSGRPASPPAVLATLNNTGEETIVHASWNGATDVAAWRVLAGAHPGALAPRATIASTGFESSTILPKKYAYAAVQALDAAGHVLGTARTVAVTAFEAALESLQHAG
ncbi:MAG TPA: arylsulfotransferase family protein [Solirubrobacteraceae bacterium]|jgi:hypothetical protein|nr:arylsulfotransferase family protein [Solirubrobacteraceae bacterium]